MWPWARKCEPRLPPADITNATPTSQLQSPLLPTNVAIATILLANVGFPWAANHSQMQEDPRKCEVCSTDKTIASTNYSEINLKLTLAPLTPYQISTQVHKLHMNLLSSVEHQNNIQNHELNTKTHHANFETQELKYSQPSTQFLPNQLKT